MIYAIGVENDPTLAHFVRGAVHAGAEVRVVGLRALAAGEWRLTIPDDGESVARAGPEEVALDPDGAFFCRLIDLSVAMDAAATPRWAAMLTALSAWLSEAPGLVVNRPGPGGHNSSKPLHEHLLAAAGLRVPPSVTSSDGERLRAFADAEPAVVKAVSGVRAHARRVRPEEFDGFDPLAGPVHLQRLVEGHDARVHVVGDEVHGLEIRATGLDYRRDMADAAFAPWPVPDELARTLVAATRDLGLAFAGWDFKLAPGGEAWCLEANPMPGYDPYDRRLGSAITGALLRLMTGDRERRGDDGLRDRASAAVG
ncbi:MAG TPA: hypothetical protein VGW75_07880 [Solirubrobacteraceae bacterium]|nr:hypothetical protein [Solirubrobacteraceae bacterium]